MKKLIVLFLICVSLTAHAEEPSKIIEQAFVVHVDGGGEEKFDSFDEALERSAELKLKGIRNFFTEETTYEGNNK